jgi:rare lipoprotein A
MRDSSAIHRATMRPYTVLGKKYYPKKVSIGDTIDGISSWYGPNFHAKKTSNGEVYNMYANTAAHKTLPMNTMVNVYNKDNGKSTIVRINDRGPFVGTRIIDLSNKAAYNIDMVQKGTANVRLTILGFHGKVNETLSQNIKVHKVGNYSIQVGVFSQYNGAKLTKSKYDDIVSNRYNVIIKKNIKDNLNKVLITGFNSEEEAIRFRSENGFQGVIIVQK